MRDRSLGAVSPLRACLRILLHLLAFFGLCVCWIPISAHSTTELPAPTSLSPFSSKFTYLDIEELQMDCQSGCPLKAFISLIPQEPTWIRRALPRAVPQCGH